MYIISSMRTSTPSSASAYIVKLPLAGGMAHVSAHSSTRTSAPASSWATEPFVPIRLPLGRTDTSTLALLTFATVAGSSAAASSAISVAFEPSPAPYMLMFRDSSSTSVRFPSPMTIPAGGRMLSCAASADRSYNRYVPSLLFRYILTFPSPLMLPLTDTDDTMPPPSGAHS